jgi:hydroxyacylglutathione hydrolase
VALSALFRAFLAALKGKTANLQAERARLRAGKPGIVAGAWVRRHLRPLPQMDFDSARRGIETGGMPSIETHLIPCLTDNYAVILHDTDSGQCLLVDAPDSEPIKGFLRARGLRLSEILVTHHHHDHTAGLEELHDIYGCRITGPERESDRIPWLTRRVGEGECDAMGYPVEILETPGHTLGALTYHIPEVGVAFTGDTLFAIGCGRIFEGDAETMFASLQKIAALPEQTAIYCGHEYTLANARFALSIEPENAALKARAAEIEAMRARGEPTLPTSIALEKATNPFLRPQSLQIRARIGMEGMPDWMVFARMRELKNKS